jgi:pyridoxine kinase
VGNANTTFVLQFRDLETASLNTVQFSKHSGYRQLKGFSASAQQLADLLAGLKMNGLYGWGAPGDDVWGSFGPEFH